MSLTAPHLTAPLGTSWKEAELATVPGQAYFAKTGPSGAVCRQCVAWGPKHRRRSPEGYLRPARCRKYVAMRKGQGLDVAAAGVPADTPACKYFSNHPRPPQEVRLIRPKKVRTSEGSEE